MIDNSLQCLIDKYKEYGFVFGEHLSQEQVLDVIIYRGLKERVGLDNAKDIMKQMFIMIKEIEQDE